jgi:hypothetical protein
MDMCSNAREVSDVGGSRTVEEMHSHGRETSTDGRATQRRAAAPAVEGRNPFELLRLGRPRRLAELPVVHPDGELAEVHDLDERRRRGR